MNKPEFFVTPGYGERNLKLFHYSQPVKIGNRLELSGQGGWNDDWKFPESITDEIAQAFRNVERTLALAGAGWKPVIHVNSYHVGLDGHQEEINRAMSERFRYYMPGRDRPPGRSRMPPSLRQALMHLPESEQQRIVEGYRKGMGQARRIDFLFHMGKPSNKPKGCLRQALFGEPTAVSVQPGSDHYGVLNTYIVAPAHC